ncbi:dTDP-4-dehydrorhamnose 3,5-epimerase [Noviherbaspirillum cavernae]|uniref:dTDP-4-dehydrorhamnose 3,5-epimerase n=1 Tax=Noviherbaspirillum cavernae TaxID=2320862 RepID=A0A418WWT4_9BURK|nr:dTDP-4-dehydrorhamnose 3,5-epimerase [Noviherbaspirillum cavernae]RJG04651.1 dTDP-4-dehydrorhamnose 3,5-epimerase [Noviherbaspirillum cavernae]
MKIIETALPEVLLIEPEIHVDGRGQCWESFNERRFFSATGLRPGFVEDNHTRSTRGALHGLHYQIRQPQAKLVRVVFGEVFDVAVDLRKSSPNFGRWTGAVLSAENRLQMWIPEGFAHGFLVKSGTAEFLYKVTDFHAPQHERAIRWDDPAIAVDWPLDAAPILSAKDRIAKTLADAEVFA